MSRPEPRRPKKSVCSGCGCTEDKACMTGCYWVEGGWCSACALNLVLRNGRTMLRDIGTLKAEVGRLKRKLKERT